MRKIHLFKNIVKLERCLLLEKPWKIKIKFSWYLMSRCGRAERELDWREEGGVITTSIIHVINISLGDPPRPVSKGLRDHSRRVSETGGLAWVAPTPDLKWLAKWQEFMQSIEPQWKKCQYSYFYIFSIFLNIFYWNLSHMVFLVIIIVLEGFA